MNENARRYHFGPLERRGVVLGLRGGQVAVLVTSAVLVILVLNLVRSQLAAVVLVLLLAMGAAMAVFAPLKGRTAEQWLPVWLGWLTGSLRGQHRWTSVAPLVGRTSTVEASADLPAYLSGLEIIAAPIDGGDVGVLKDAAAQTYAAVVAVSGRSFALLDRAEKERLVESWGSVLSGMARDGSPIRRLQWVERTVPDDGDAIARYLRERAVESTNSSVVKSYLRLVEGAGPATQQHETLIVLQVDARRATRAIKLAKGDVDQGACAVLVRELHSLHSRLASSEVIIEGVLPPRLLARAIRSAVDPDSRQRAAAHDLTADRVGVAPSQAWPLVSHTHWGCLQTEAAWHATYWVSEWPRIDVGCDWLAPLLLQSTAMRSVSVVMEPIPAQRAARDVERDRTTDLSEQSIKARAGFRRSARKEHEGDNVERREQELAEGHTDYRFSAYVTVTARSADELEVACGEIEQLAQQSRLELRPMRGEQDVAFSFTLPLARGLR